MLYGDEYGGQYGADDNWEIREMGLITWLLAASDLPEGSVIFSQQNGPRPAVPFIDVRIDGLTPVGAADGNDQEYVDSNDPGEEIEITTRGVREMPVTIRCFTANAVGASSAREILARVQASLGLASMRDLLHDGGMTCFDRGTVQAVPAILDTKWEGRAVLTLGMYVEENAIDLTGYVSTVELTNEIPDPDNEFTVEG